MSCCWDAIGSELCSTGIQLFLCSDGTMGLRMVPSSSLPHALKVSKILHVTHVVIRLYINPYNIKVNWYFESRILWTILLWTSQYVYGGTVEHVLWLSFVWPTGIQNCSVSSVSCCTIDITKAWCSRNMFIKNRMRLQINLSQSDEGQSYCSN